MADLKTFIGNLSQDSALKAKYLQDPTKAMTEAGVSAADQEAVLSGDRAKIAARIQPGAAQPAFGISVNVLVVLGIS
jgi:hypothetical protein